jgi:hypothetical protein
MKLVELVPDAIGLARNQGVAYKASSDIFVRLVRELSWCWC